MNEAPEQDDCSSTREGRGGIEADPDHLAEMEAKLVRGLQRALADGRLDVETMGHLDLKEFARRLASRSEATERRHARISRWMMRLDRRVRQVESRLAVLTSQAADQREAIRMIGSILQDRDDPYGFGFSLDERFAYDEPDQAADGGEG
jgi:hypothetical protein